MIYTKEHVDQAVVHGIFGFIIMEFVVVVGLAIMCGGGAAAYFTTVHMLGL